MMEEGVQPESVLAELNRADAAPRANRYKSEGDLMDDGELREKLRKIEALFAGAATPGERAAAGAAAERIRDRLREAGGTELSVEMTFN